MASHSSPGDTYQSTGGRSEITQCQAKMAAWNSFSYLWTRDLHAFLSFARCRAASTVIPLLPKPTSTPSIQPNLAVPRTRSPLPSAINTLLAIRYSPFFPRAQTISILSDLIYSLTHFLFKLFDAPLHSNLYPFVTLQQISQTLHLKKIHFLSLNTSHNAPFSTQRRWYNYSSI